jgi:hypothetical protein
MQKESDADRYSQRDFVAFRHNRRGSRCLSSGDRRAEIVNACHAARTEIPFRNDATERQLAAKGDLFDMPFGLRLFMVATIAWNMVRYGWHSAPALLEGDHKKPVRLVRAIRNVRGGCKMCWDYIELRQDVFGESRPIRQQKCGDSSDDYIADWA